MNEPEVVIQAGATAMSQLEMSDDTREDVRNTMVNRWGFDDIAYEDIMLEANEIRNESNEVE